MGSSGKEFHGIHGAKGGRITGAESSRARSCDDLQPPFQRGSFRCSAVAARAHLATNWLAVPEGDGVFFSGPFRRRPVELAVDSIAEAAHVFDGRRLIVDMAPRLATIRGFPVSSACPVNAAYPPSQPPWERPVGRSHSKSRRADRSPQWIRQFRGKTTVIKLGGSVMEDDRAMDPSAVGHRLHGDRRHAAGAGPRRRPLDQPGHGRRRLATPLRPGPPLHRRRHAGHRRAGAGRRGQRFSRPPHRRTRRPGPSA